MYLCFVYLSVKKKFKIAIYCCNGDTLRMGEERKVYKVLLGKPEGRRPLGRPRRRWEDGVRMDLREIGVDWIGFDWLRTGTGGGLL
jgi:hypothetical protein